MIINNKLKRKVQELSHQHLHDISKLEKHPKKIIKNMFQNHVIKYEHT